jgi:hypothetical protein
MSEPKNYNRWDLSEVQDQFNIDSDVVLPSCEWKERKLTLFAEMMQEIEKEEEKEK